MIEHVLLPEGLKPLLQVGEQDESAANALVQSPTAPLVGAIEASHVVAYNSIQYTMVRAEIRHNQNIKYL